MVPVDGRGRPTGKATLDARGVVDENDPARALDAARQEAASAILGMFESTRDGVVEETVLTEAVRLAVRASFYRSLGFKPVTVVVTVRVTR